MRAFISIQACGYGWSILSRIQIKSPADADFDDRRGVAETPPQMARSDRVFDREEFLQPPDLRVEDHIVVIVTDFMDK